MNLPIDLMKGGGAMDLSEAQDFSMSKPSKGGSHSTSPNVGGGAGSKSKMNDILSKLMKKNNVVSFGSG